MAYFLLRLNGPRPTFPSDMNDAERRKMREHFVYWQDKAGKGTAIAVGPVMDPKGPWGMGVVTCADEAAARTLCDGDPVIQAGLGFSYEIFVIPSIILPAA
jgi:YCII-related domain